MNKELYPQKKKRLRGVVQGFDREVAYRINDLILRGNSKTVAANAAGITRAKLKIWEEKGRDLENAYEKETMEWYGIGVADEDPSEYERDKVRKQDAIYVWYKEFRKAEAEAEARMVEHIYGAAERKDDAKPVQWLLERRFADWRLRQEIDLTTETKDPPEKMDLSKLSDEDLETLRRLQEKALVDDDGQDQEE